MQAPQPSSAPDPRPAPLDHLPARGAQNAPALATKEGVLDYAGLEAAVGALAGILAAQDLAPGERVATWLPKTRIASLMPLAAARAGLVHVPINPLLKRAQVRHILADSGAARLLTGPARAATLQESDFGKASLLLEADATALMATADPLPPSGAGPDDLAALLYTSGSTGSPKGVMLSHANLWLGAVSVASYLRLTPEDRVLAVLPLSFDYGQSQLFSTWAAGGLVLPFDYLSPADLIRAIGRHDVTTLAGVPPLWVQLVEARWPPDIALKLRRLTNSGGKLPSSLIRRMREMFPLAELYPMYGLTEAFRSTYLDPSLVDSHPDSIGTAIPFAEILVVRPDGSETDPDEAGELVHVGPLVAKGYWRDPERTAARFRPAPASSRRGGTAVHSGDTVRRDAKGLLYFIARSDAMIKTSGNRVSPTEVEEAAIASGVVAEAAAMGVEDDRLGQAILLVVRPQGAADEAALAAHLKAVLPNFMQPRQIVWRNALPRNPNGKIDRDGLRGEYVR